MEHDRSKIILRALGAIFILSLFLYVLTTLHGTFLKYVDLISIFLIENRFLGIFIFTAISILAVMLSPFSSLPLIPSAIAAWGKLFTAFFLGFGWFIGAWVAYALGKYARDKILSRFWRFEKIEYYRKKFSSKTQFGLVLLFRFAVPSEITGYTLGIIKYDLKKYLLATFLTEIPFVFASVYLSQALVEGRFLIFAAVLAFLAALIFMASYFLKKKI